MDKLVTLPSGLLQFGRQHCYLPFVVFLTSRYRRTSESFSSHRLLHFEGQCSYSTFVMLRTAILETSKHGTVVARTVAVREVVLLFCLPLVPLAIDKIVTLVTRIVAVREVALLSVFCRPSWRRASQSLSSPGLLRLGR